MYVHYQGCIQGVPVGHAPPHLGTGLPHLQGLEANPIFIGPKACKKGRCNAESYYFKKYKIAVIMNSTEKARSLPTNLELPV